MTWKCRTEHNGVSISMRLLLIEQLPGADIYNIHSNGRICTVCDKKLRSTCLWCQWVRTPRTLGVSILFNVSDRVMEKSGTYLFYGVSAPMI
jgi:hypothetical protein